MSRRWCRVPLREAVRIVGIRREAHCKLAEVGPGVERVLPGKQGAAAVVPVGQ